MKPVVLNPSDSKTPLYLQLYRYIKGEITCGNMPAGEKLPSLRKLAKDLGISVTTSEQAYNQLLVEGYIYSRPQSGFFVSDLPGSAESGSAPAPEDFDFSSYTFQESSFKYDLSCFDFQKWKKCMSKVFSDYTHLLLFGSDVQGEIALRYEISRYVYTSRGVTCRPDQIVIGAGTQQLAGYLCRILRRMGIGTVCVEDPGYTPVFNIFRDHGFDIENIPVEGDGLVIEDLPRPRSSAVYVSPSNQFPTGSVMPVGRRYQLLDWAKETKSVIIEDDYDSELRYFGKPLPALQGLVSGSPVVYLGSFSSTLFPAIKISYMILPENMAEIFQSFKYDYSQTCSKTEQLTLALFMEEGYYYTGIKKMRALYAQKLKATLDALSRYGSDFISPINNLSGINLILKVRTAAPAANLASKAESLGLRVQPLSLSAGGGEKLMAFYYNQIPLGEIDESVKSMVELWRKNGDV